MKQYRADIDNVRDALKKGRDLEKNENLVRRYLADSLFCNDISLHLLLAEVVKKAYEAGNEKMYLKQTVDTAGFFNTGRRMFLACETLDSLDARPNDKGIVNPAYRKKNAEFLAPYRENVFEGARFFYVHERWQEAWDCIDTYLDCHNQPLFSNVCLDNSNNTYAAYISMMAGVKMESLQCALKYAEIGMDYESRREASYEILADLCHKKGEEAMYLNYLKRGFELNPLSSYFYPRLFDYYEVKADNDSAMFYIDRVLELDSLNELCLLAKHTLLMDMEKYDSALEYGLRLLALNDSVAEPNYNVGYIYYLKAQKAATEKGKTYRQRQKDAQVWYRRLLPFMEMYRNIKPDGKQRWKPILYDAYLNLNMGEEFAEIENE